MTGWNFFKPRHFGFSASDRYLKNLIRTKAENADVLYREVNRILFWMRLKAKIKRWLPPRFIRTIWVSRPQGKTLAQEFGEKEVNPKTSSWKAVVKK